MNKIQECKFIFKKFETILRKDIEIIRMLSKC